jgi:diamine N-acetyltransferase
MKRTIAPISGERIRLRLLQENDLPMTLRWRNQEHIRRWFVYSDRITPEQHANWFSKYLERDNDFVFVIEEADILHKPIGQVSLYDINWDTKEAEFGRLMIGEADASGRGLAREATELIVGYGFEQLGLQHIYLEVYEDNIAAIAIYQKCGFVETARNENLLQMSRRQ